MSKKDEKKHPDKKEAPKKSEVEQLKDELVEAKDKYVRLFAEFDNMRKRNERERIELIKYAHEDVIIEMLGFFEDFERCIEAARHDEGMAEGGKTLLKGVEMTFKRMQELLNKYDVKPIEPVGQMFDHNAHEALMMVESDEYDDNTVVEVFQRGYMIGGRVARTAKVKVARKSAVKEEVQDPGTGEE